MEAATTEVRTVSPVAGSAAILRRAREVYLPQLIGALALIGIVGGTLLVAIAAIQGHSNLSTSLQLHPPRWLTWPFGGLWRSRTNDHRDLQVGLLAIMFAMFACYGVALAFARRMHPAIVWSAVVAAYVVCFLSPPLLLTDVFNYIGYGRMGVIHHLNPYTHLPVAASHDPVFKLNNWHHLRSPYGPLFTLGTYAIAPLGLAGSYWAYKAGVMLATLGCAVLTWMIARRIERPALPALVLVGLNPVVLVYGTAGQHNDAFMLLLTLAAVYLAVTRRESLGAAAMVGAAAVKASAALLVPVIALGAERRGRAILGVLGGAVIFGGLGLAGFGPHLPAISDQARLVAPWSIPNLFGILIGHGGADAPVRAAMEVIVVAATIACSAWAWRRREVIAPLGWLTLVSLITIAWDMPWYIQWLLPFIAFVRQRSFRVLAVVVTAWLMVSYLPYFGNVASKLGVNPAHTATAHVNQHYTSSRLK